VRRTNAGEADMRRGADARGSGEKVDQVFVSTSYFLGVEKWKMDSWSYRALLVTIIAQEQPFHQSAPQCSRLLIFSIK
jgi:hypothetical protein